MTAFTSGREMTSRLSPELKFAATLSARTEARTGSLSETARKSTEGWEAAIPARRVPIRPDPTTAIPNRFPPIQPPWPVPGPALFRRPGERPGPALHEAGEIAHQVPRVLPSAVLGAVDALLRLERYPEGVLKPVPHV